MTVSVPSRAARALCSFGAAAPPLLHSVDAPANARRCRWQSGAVHAYTSRASFDRPLVWLSMVSLLQPPGGVLATRDAGGHTPAATPAAAAPDGGWPRRYTAPRRRADRALRAAGRQLGRPEAADAARGRGVHRARAATTALLGTIIAEADTRVSVAERLVDFSSFRIIQSNFPIASKEQVSAAVAAIKASMPATRARHRARSRARRTSMPAPSVRRTSTASRPIRRGVLQHATGGDRQHRRRSDLESRSQNNDLRFAVNTNWDLFEHPPSKTVLPPAREDLAEGDRRVTGPWAAGGHAAASFSKLPADDNWKEVRAALPVREGAASAVPTVFVSTMPAELILLRGAPQYEPVPGTRLLWVRNTESDVFRLGTTGPVYYLVAGRWFSAPGFDGPWTFATLTLPADFARFRSNTSDRACWRRCPARCRRPKPCCWRRCRRPRA